MRLQAPPYSVGIELSRVVRVRYDDKGKLLARRDERLIGMVKDGVEPV